MVRGSKGGSKMLKNYIENNFLKSLPTSLCPPGQRPSWAGGKREEHYPP